MAQTVVVWLQASALPLAQSTYATRQFNNWQKIELAFRASDPQAFPARSSVGRALPEQIHRAEQSAAPLGCTVQKADDLDARMFAQSCRHPRSAPVVVRHNPTSLLQFDLLPIIELCTKPRIRTNLRISTKALGLLPVVLLRRILSSRS
jgi:hypothetical protein